MIKNNENWNSKYISIDPDHYDVDEFGYMEIDLSDYLEFSDVNLDMDNLHDEQKLELFLDNINDIRLEEFEQMIKQWKDERVQR